VSILVECSDALGQALESTVVLGLPCCKIA
jgi:hypothetical protein